MPSCRRPRRFGHLAVPVRSPRLALREARPDTAVRAESARWSSFAVRADGSWRSAATATPWTSNRASGSAMASSSQVRSRADRKTHMLSVPSSTSRLKAGPWLRGADVQDFCRLSCASVVSPVARSAHSRACLNVFAALPAARRANHHAGEAGPRALQGDDHDIVQFLAAGQDDDQDFCLRRHLVRCALRAKSPRSAPSGRQLLRAWRRGCWQGWRRLQGRAGCPW